MPSRFEIEQTTRKVKAYQPPPEARPPSIPPFATLTPADLTPSSGYRLRVTPEMVQAAREERAARWARETEKRNTIIVASLWAFAALTAGALAFVATSSGH